MKKTLILLLALSGFAQADDETYYAYYGIATTNPPAVVAAMDEFNDSECGQKTESTVALMSETFNGGEPSTHTFVVTYNGSKVLDETLATLSTCPDYATFLTEMAEVSIPTEQNLVKAVYEQGDWTQDTVFAVFEMNIKNEDAYLTAYKAMTDAMVEQGQLTSSYGLERVVAGTDFSHFAFIGGTNVSSLMETLALLDMKNPDFAKFQNAVRRNRSIVRRGIVNPVKAWE
jgi:hypothetical protein